MNIIASLLIHEIDELIAIILTDGEYEKNFYEGILRQVNEKDIVIEITLIENNQTNVYLMPIEYNTFILATPLDRYY